MKTLAAIILSGALARAEGILPQMPDKSRYAETVGKSPFVLATKAVEEPTVEKVNPFKDLYLRGIGKADDKDYVLVQRLGEEKPMRFIGTEPGDDGMSVKTVRVGNNFRETKVVMQKGAEIGEIGFKEEAITAAPAMPQSRPGQPAVPGGMPGFSRPGFPTVPGAAAPSSRVITPSTSTIPRPQVPVAVPLPNPTATNVPPSAGTPGGVPTRQRVRVINN
jgi:hypothetical protein